MSARSYLYVPGNRPDRFDKAAGSGADAVILDLEDAVGIAEKDDARAMVAAFLRRRQGRAPQWWVRVNAGDRMEADARAVAAGADGISLPKVSSPSDVESLHRALGDEELPVIPLIETASGVLDARAIASAPRVVRLAIGEIDLSADLGAEPSDETLTPLRMQVVAASAATGIDQPVASVSTDYRDLDAFARSTEALRRMGFGARAAIHPAQVLPINAAFTPTASEVAAARALLAGAEEAGGGVFVGEDGRMVDEAVLRSARRIAARARR